MTIIQSPMRALILILALAALWSGVIALPAHGADAPGCGEGERRLVFAQGGASRDGLAEATAAEFAKRLNAALDGRACLLIRTVGSGAEGEGEGALFAALASGEALFAAPSIAALAELSPEFRIFDLPFLFTDLADVIAFQQAPKAVDLLAAPEKAGLKGLAYWVRGMRQIAANRPVALPEDLRGLRVGVSGSARDAAYYSLLGADPVSMSAQDLAGALSAGAADGREAAWSEMSAAELISARAAVSETNHSVIADVVLTSADAWADLPRGLRAEIERILLEVSHERNGFALQRDGMNRRNVIAAGGAVRRLDSTERAAWIAALRPVWRELEADVGADLIAAAAGAKG